MLHQKAGDASAEFGDIVGGAQHGNGTGMKNLLQCEPRRYALIHDVRRMQNGCHARSLSDRVAFRPSQPCAARRLILVRLQQIEDTKYG